jgi:predicted permease
LRNKTEDDGMDGMIAEFLMVADRIFILVLLIAAGYIALAAGVLDRHSTGRISALLINVTIPALIIVSMQVPFSPDRLANTEEMVLLTGALYVLSFAVAYLTSRALSREAAEQGVFQFAVVFGNVGFMGFPVIEAIYGPEALFFVAIFNLVFNILVFSVGIAMMTEGQREGFDPKMLANPGIAASIVGFLLFLGSIEIPSPFIDSLAILGDVTTPLAMIVVGALLATFPAREMVGNWRTAAVSAIRLLIVPVIFWFLARPFVTDPLIFGVLITLAAMPVAANTVIFAEQYGSDSRLASQVVFVSTIGSLMTIPLITTVLV